LTTALLPSALLTVAVAAAATSDSRLVEAARNRDVNRINFLLGQHADVKTTAGDGSTALLWSAHWADLDVADLLLQAGADPNAANDLRMTPLSQACTNGSDPFVRLLLKSGANPNTAIGTGVTPLMTCAKSGSVDAVKRLLEYGAEINAKEPSQGQTALMWAAAEHQLAVAKALIDAHADLKAHSKSGFTAMHFAARRGDQMMIELLLASGVDINILSEVDGGGKGAKKPEPGGRPSSSGSGPVAEEEVTSRKTPGTLGYTPLLVATVRGQVPLALWLLDHGADPNIGDAGLTPLHWASTEWESYTANRVYGFDDPMGGIPDREAKLRLVKALLAHGANPNARMTKGQPQIAGGYEDAVGATPFLLASSVADVEIMRILLDAGADPKQTTATKTTAIMAATGLNHGIGESAVTELQAIAAVKLLLDLGLDPRGSTVTGENALFGPAYRGWNTLLVQMMDLGVDVNAVSKAGVTPWRAAAGQGDRLGGVLFNNQGADLLLKRGADPKLGRVCESQNKCRAE
jgi:ankyrin repeat protein